MHKLLMLIIPKQSRCASTPFQREVAYGWAELYLGPNCAGLAYYRIILP